MSFPMEEYPILQQLYAIFNTAGIGGIVVVILGGGATASFLLAFLWIRQGGSADETNVYAFPTPALHAHESEEPQLERELPPITRGFRRMRREPRETEGT